MRKQILPLILLLATGALCAQTQWAAAVVDVSSQENNSALQLSGAPDAQLSAGTWRGVWTPRAAESFYPESITVRFQNPQRADRVTVVECDKPGAISRIVAIDEANQAHVLYQNDYPRVILKPSREFVAEFPLTDYRIVQLQVSLNTKAVRGYNRIDAIGIGAGPVDTMSERVTRRGPASANAGSATSPFNTPYHEHAPVLSADGRTLYFARRYHPQNVGREDRDDIYVSRRLPSGQWSRAITVGSPVNGMEHDRPVGCSTDGDVLYLLREYRDGSRELLTSQRTGRAYTQPRRLSLPANLNLAPADAFVAADGSLYGITTGGELLEVSPIGALRARRMLPQTVTAIVQVSEDGQTVYATDAAGATLILELEQNYWVVDRTVRAGGGARGGMSFALAPREVIVADGTPDHYDLSAHLLTEPMRPRSKTTSEFAARGTAPATEVTTRPYESEVSQRPGHFAELPVGNPRLAQQQLDRIDPNEDLVASVRQLELRVQRLEAELRQLQPEPRTEYAIQPGFEERVLRPVANGYDYDREYLRRRYDAQQRAASSNRGTAQPLTEEEKVAQLREKFNRANRRAPVQTSDFADYERAVVGQLRHELQPRLTDELYRQLVEDVKTQVRAELSESERDHLPGVSIRLVNQHRETTPATAGGGELPVITENVSNRIEADLRRALEPGVRAELHRQLEPQIREQVRRELIYQVKRQVRDELTGSIGTESTDVGGTAPFSTAGSASSNRYVALHAGNVIRLNNLHYYANEADLLPDSDAELDRVTELLIANPRLIVEIAVHTHGQLDAARAKTLTDARARNVRDALLARGIEPARVLALGYGSREPISDNATEAGRRMNQRTELRIL